MKLIKLVGWLILGIVGLGIVMAMVPDQSDYFQVRRVDLFFPGDGMQLQVVNVGKEPITIKKVNVNERPDCVSSEGGGFPRTLQIGDRLSIAVGCRVIRTEMITDKGSLSYSFN